MTRLIIARHGNTFDHGEIVRRVGLRTDLPLSSSGVEQAKKLGRHWRQQGLCPDTVFTSQLLRTQQTADHALREAGCEAAFTPLSDLNEIDYGVDENQPEEAVQARLGKQALQSWEEQGIVPAGWLADAAQIIASWREFAANMLRRHAGKTILAVTSNGVARFALALSEEKPARIKLATGAYGILFHDGHVWHCRDWNIRP